MNIGSGLHQQFDGLAEAVPGHLVKRRVAVLKGKEKKTQTTIRDISESA